MIRLRIKSVDCKEQVKDLQAPSDWSVVDLKKEIRLCMSPFPTVENQRLIHAGKLLSDEAILGSFLTIQESPHHIHLALKNGRLYSAAEEARNRSDEAEKKKYAQQQLLSQQYLLQVYYHQYYSTLYYNAYVNAIRRNPSPKSTSETTANTATTPPPPPTPPPAPTPPPPAPAPPAPVQAPREEPERRRDGLDFIYMSIQLFIFSCMVYFNSSGTRILFVILVWFLFYFFKRHNEAQRLREAQQIPQPIPVPPTPATPATEEDNNSNQREEEAPPPPAETPNPHFLQQILSIFVSFFASLIPEPQPLHG